MTPMTPMSPLSPIPAETPRTPARKDEGGVDSDMSQGDAKNNLAALFGAKKSQNNTPSTNSKLLVLSSLLLFCLCWNKCNILRKIAIFFHKTNNIMQQRKRKSKQNNQKTHTL